MAYNFTNTPVDRYSLDLKTSDPRALPLADGTYFILVPYRYDSDNDALPTLVGYKYLADGTLDTSFGSVGVMDNAIELPGGQNNQLPIFWQAVELTNGSLISLSKYDDPADPNTRHRRFNINLIGADGSYDGTRKAMNGAYTSSDWATINATLVTFSSGGFAVVELLFNQPDMVDQDHYAIRIKKYNADTTLDTSFGSAGTMLKLYDVSDFQLTNGGSPPMGHGRSNDVIVMGWGYQSSGTDPGAWAVRFFGDSNTVSDPEWVDADLDPSTFTHMFEIHETNSRLIIAGYTQDGDGNPWIQMAAFTTVPAADATYGSGGYAKHNNIPVFASEGATTSSWFGEYGVDTSGRVYALDSLSDLPDFTNTDPAAWRYTDVGAIDTGFGVSGVLRLTGAGLGLLNTVLPASGGQPGFAGWTTNMDNTSYFGLSAIFESVGPVTVNRTVNKLIAVSGRKTYIGNDPSSLDGVANYSGFQIDDTKMFVSAATLFGYTYIVDGTHLYKINLGSELFETYTASAGTAPAHCTIAVNWRGRLVLSGDSTDPQNVFASRVGNPLDWDYGQEDPESAWAGNAAPSGRVGEPVVALAPISDDLMLIFSDNTIYAVSGDPADGGSINLLSDKCGIVGPTAWCRDAAGSIYFVGANGLYKANPDGTNPVEISRDVYRQFFQNTNRSTRHTTLVFDPARYGIWVFVSQDNQPDAAEMCLFYDIRLEGYWPVRFTNSIESGPLAAIYWDGFEDNTRFPLMGGYAGQLDSMNFVNRRDNGGAIDCYLFYGPIAPYGPTNDGIVTKLNVTGGEIRIGDTSGAWNMNWRVIGGDTAYHVTEGYTGQPHQVAGNVSIEGRVLTRVTRCRGTWFTVRLSNSVSGNYFTVENVNVNCIPAGRIR